MHAVARLENLVVVTWAADPAALADLLPPGVSVDIPLVSAVAYSYRDLHLAGVPRPRLACGQIHLRAYVRVGDDRGVWFLDTVQDSRWASVTRWMWGMPWRRGHVDLRRADDGAVTATAAGIALRVTPSPEGTAPEPRTVDPTIGWYGGRGGVRRFSVDYTAAAPDPAAVDGAVVPALDGLRAADGPPPSAFLRSEVAIEITLPPRPIGI